MDLTVCFSSEPDTAVSFLCGLCWIIFEIVQKPRVLKKVNEVANKGLYSENHWGFQRGRREYKWQLMVVYFYWEDLTPGVRGRKLVYMRCFTCVFSKERKVILGINVLKVINWGSKWCSLNHQRCVLKFLYFFCISKVIKRVVFKCAVQEVWSQFVNTNDST